MGKTVKYRLASMLLLVILIPGPLLAIQGVAVPGNVIENNYREDFQVNSIYDEMTSEREIIDANENNDFTTSSESESYTQYLDHSSDILEPYKESIYDTREEKTQYYTNDAPGISMTYFVEGSSLFVEMIIGSYEIVDISIEGGEYQALVIDGAESSHTYGHPILPYSKISFSIPESITINDVEIKEKNSISIYDLGIIPGPEPLMVHSDYASLSKPYFDDIAYSSSSFTPSELIDFEIMGTNGDNCAMLSVHPVQYNPMARIANLNVRMLVEISLSEEVSPLSISEIPLSESDQWSFLPNTIHILLLEGRSARIPKVKKSNLTVSPLFAAAANRR
ncbi:MAG: C25 family peptidase propeptide domain-containing protein [Candidatus Thorarchaeota archaeon]|nr:C25 family peptidase propeptide domain-containing protein [Candidatus Thorarchaeota archaeon]